MTEHQTYAATDADQAVDEHERRWKALGEELRRRLGPGAPLEPHVRTRFEGRLGGDLSSTMVHRSPLSGHLARALGAQAVTAGHHVVGSSDDLDPTTSAGAGLLGHELTHVIQRDTSLAGERAAQTVERALTGEPDGASTGSPSAAIDTEQLAERVYQRIVDELLREQDRAAWVS